MAGRPTDKKPSPQGERLVALRKSAGLSQAELAKIVGMPQRTLSQYERAAVTFPAAKVAPLAHALGVSAEEVLGIKSDTTQKRGPKSKLDRQFEKIQRLPKTRQNFISKLLDEMLAGK